MMRIGNNGIDSLGNGSVGSVGGTGSEHRNATSGAASKSDSVSLSSAASLVALAKSSAASRQSKIQGLSADVKSGKYQSNDAQVSHAFVQSHIAA